MYHDVQLTVHAILPASTTMAMTSGLLNRLHYLPIVALSFYALFIALIIHPRFQAHNVFLHSINFPFHVNLSQPDKIKGLTAGRVRNFVTTTSDDIRISGWHLLPNNIQSVPHSDRSGDGFDEALCQRPTLLYFHGNAMNRAAPFRIEAYAQFTALNVNVVAIDYRGFGDSEGTPTEAGLQRDARAAYRWIKERQHGVRRGHDSDANSPAIFVVGQSLGTGVASRLTLDLVRAGDAPEALFLIAPYTSIRSLLASYKIGGLIPVFWPIGVWSILSDLADRHLYTRFESDKALYQITKRGLSHLFSRDEIERYSKLDHTLTEAELLKELGVSSHKTARRPHIVISHADDDAVIPNSHGRSLLHTISLALGQVGEERQEGHGWGETLTLHDDEDDRDFVLVKSRKGGHNGVPEYTVKLFGSIVGLD